MFSEVYSINYCSLQVKENLVFSNKFIITLSLAIFRNGICRDISEALILPDNDQNGETGAFTIRMGKVRGKFLLMKFYLCSIMIIDIKAALHEKND